MPWGQTGRGALPNLFIDGKWAAISTMRIHLLSLNYAPEQIGIGPYSAEMAEAFAAAGHHVTVSTAKPYYPAWKIDAGYDRPGAIDRVHNGVAIRHHDLYVPARPSGLKRVIHYLSFACRVMPHMLRTAMRDRPDIIMATAPSLIAAKVAILAGRMCGARTWLHVQDFEVEAAFATGLLPGGGFRSWFARLCERSVMTHFDVVSSISPQMCARLRGKGVAADRIVEFRNWADISAIRPLERESAYRAELGITTPHVALYSGNISNKQGVEILAQVARLLANRRDLTFVICGDGPSLPGLRAACDDLGNVRFIPLQPRERLNELVGLATVHLLPQKADAADLVLPSKLTNMLASGRPVVATAEPGTGLADEVEGAGLVVPPGDPQAMARGITRLLDDTLLRARTGAAARARAEARWEKGAILAAVQRRMHRLVGGQELAEAEAEEPAAALHLAREIATA